MKKMLNSIKLSTSSLLSFTCALVLASAATLQAQTYSEGEYAWEFERDSDPGDGGYAAYQGLDGVYAPPHQWQSRVDIYYAGTHRSPDHEVKKYNRNGSVYKRDGWSPIREGAVNYYHKFSPDFTILIGATGYNRWSNGEGNGAIGTLAAWKDWTPRLYTFTAIASGSNSVYLPRFRFDQDFYLKLGDKYQFVVPIGFTYFDYYVDNREYTVSTGLHYYWKKWLFVYRLFWHVNEPGNHQAVSNKFNITYGQEGVSWTYFDVIFGKQAFAATYVTPIQAINRNSFGVNLNHRHWFGCHWGFFGELGYTWVEAPYILYRASIGFFQEF